MACAFWQHEARANCRIHQSDLVGSKLGTDPKEKEVRTFICVIALFILGWMLQGCASVPPTEARAESQAPLSEPMQMGGGMVCDTKDEVRLAMIFYLYGKGIFPSGCGHIVGNVIAQVRPLEVVDLGEHEYSLVEIHFILPQHPMQYGMYGQPRPK